MISLRKGYDLCKSCHSLSDFRQLASEKLCIPKTTIFDFLYD